MNNAENIEKILKQTKLKTTPALDQKILKAAGLELKQSTHQAHANNTPGLTIWRTIMKTKTTKFVAAALIIVAAMIGINSFLGTGTSVAFADVVNPILTARTATFKLTTTIQGTDVSYEVMYMDPARSRSLMPGGIIVIGDMNQGKVVMLLPSKKATVSIIPTEEQKKGGLFEVIRLIRQAQQHENESVEFLGEQKIEGNSVIGYRITHDDRRLTIWADSVTLLPIQIECICSLSIEERIFLLTDFVFDIELDESLFSLEIPEGYTIVEALKADDFEGAEK